MVHLVAAIFLAGLDAALAEHPRDEVVRQFDDAAHGVPGHYGVMWDDGGDAH